MKIGYVCHLYPPYLGGVGKYVHEIATRLGAHHDVWVICTDPSGRLPKTERVGNVCIIRFAAWAFGESVYYSPELLRYMREHTVDFDLVHANNYHALPAYYAAISKKMNRLVFSPHFHGAKGHSLVRNLLHVPYRLLGWDIFRKSDLIVCSSYFERNQLMRDFRVPEHKLMLIRQGVDYPRNMPAHEARERKTLLCVSRLEKYKRVQYVIRALKHLPSFDLVIVGTGPYAETLHRLAEELGLEDRIYFKQAVSEAVLRAIYRDADAAILLSEHESYSQFIAEALTAGIPCVVAKRDALIEWIDGNSCIGVDQPANAIDVARAVLRLVGRKVKRRLPTWDDYAAKLETIYQELVC